MATLVRRAVVVGALGMLSAAFLVGCSSTISDSRSSPSAPASRSVGVVAPVIINVDETVAAAKVGDNLDILVADNDIAGTTVSTNRPDLVELTQAYEDGSATFNPGGKVLAAGTASITVQNPDGSARVITLTITK